MSKYKLLATLSDAGVDYVLIGGLAVTLHGYHRVTEDQAPACGEMKWP